MREVYTRNEEHPKRLQTAVIAVLAVITLAGALGTCIFLPPRVVEVDRATLRAEVTSMDPDGYWWWYHGTEGGFHYIERRQVAIICALSDYFRIVEQDMPVPRPFEFLGWRPRDARQVFERWEGDNPTIQVIDSEWLEPPDGFPDAAFKNKEDG